MGERGRRMRLDSDGARGRLVRLSPWLAPALGRLSMEAWDGEAPATDGERLFVPEGMDRDGLALALAHCTAHCLLGHVYARDVGALAADVAAALTLDQVFPALCSFREAPLYRLAKHRLSGVPLGGVPGAVGADGFFRENAGALSALLKVDDHGLWQSQRPFAVSGGAGEGWRRLWRRYGDRLEGDRAGRNPGGISRAIRLDAPPDRSYRRLLERYAACREEPREDPDSFEQGLYAYGLARYGNLPLIEPAECREVRRIDELAIVIDTSGSCIETLTARFLNETRAMLSDERLFARRFNLRILQCDAKVQREDVITCLRDFEHYIDGLRIVGGGGTDFRPAFERIDRLIARGAWRRLPAALFLSDGLGLFPSKPPEYETVFILYRNHFDAIDVPAWARTLVMEAD